MQRTNNNRQTAIFLMLILPFAGLVFSLAHWRESWAKNAFWLACVYLGAVFIFLPAGTTLGGGADGGEYVLRLIDMHNDDSISFWGIISKFQQDQRYMDLYQPLMTLLVSRFTDNGHVLFTLYAFVFGFFYSRNVWYILDKIPYRKLGSVTVFVILFFLLCPIYAINGVRMWTALHVFVYGMMPYLFEKDRSRLWWVVVATLVHFSFLYVSALALLFAFLPFGLKTRNYSFAFFSLLFFVLTLFFNTLNLDMVNGMLAEYSPESYEQRIGTYVNADYASNIADLNRKNNWYVAASGNIEGWCYNLLLIAVLPCLRRNFKHDKSLTHLYVFTLILGGFANIMALIPSGGRFQLLSQMFKVPLFILMAMGIPRGDSFRKYMNTASFFLLLPMVFNFRKMLDYYSITALLGNFITVFFWENNVPLITLIKMII